MIRIFNRKFRSRAVSIENVILGIVVVLIFAGLLYGAFSILNRKIEASDVQRRVSIISNEINMIHRQVGADAFSNMYGSGYGYVDMLEYLDGIAAFDQPIFDRSRMQFNRVLPYEGVIRIQPYMHYTDVFLGWDTNTGRQSRLLCNAIAADPGVIGNSQQLDEYSSNPPERLSDLGLISGPLGYDYAILINDCDGELIGYPMFRMVIVHQDAPFDY